MLFKYRMEGINMRIRGSNRDGTGPRGGGGKKSGRGRGGC